MKETSFLSPITKRKKIRSPTTKRMAPTTRSLFLEKRDIDQEQANHWKIYGTIPEDSAKAKATTKPDVAPEPPNLTTIQPNQNIQPSAYQNQNLLLRPVVTQAMHGIRDNSKEQLTTYPSKVTHLLLPALLTKLHRENAALIQQPPKYTDLLKEWKILVVHKVNNMSKGYFNFIAKLIPQFQDFQHIKFQPQGIYMSLATQKKYKQLLIELTNGTGDKVEDPANASTTTPELVMVPTPPTTAQGPATMTAEEKATREALIHEQIESIITAQAKHRITIEKMVGYMDQMQYNIRTQGKRIEKLTSMTNDQSQHIHTQKTPLRTVTKRY